VVDQLDDGDIDFTKINDNKSMIYPRDIYLQNYEHDIFRSNEDNKMKAITDLIDSQTKRQEIKRSPFVNLNYRDVLKKRAVIQHQDYQNIKLEQSMTIIGKEKDSSK